jgi:hypothetical protein
MFDDERTRGSIKEEAKTTMRFSLHNHVIRLLAVAAVASLMVGCQIPGSSFATEPLQLRFAEATQRSLLASEKAERSATRPEAQPMRSAEKETIVRVKHTR